jgi:hypothetical protein
MMKPKGSLLLLATIFLGITLSARAQSLRDKEAKPPSSAAALPGVSSPQGTQAAEGKKGEALVGMGQQSDELGLSKEVLEKLSPEDIHSLIVQKMRLQRDLQRPPPEAPSDLFFLITNLVPLSVFLFLFLSVGAVFYFRYHTERLKYETMRAMVEQGMNVPPELICPAKAATNANADLRRGMVLVSAGLGVCGCFWIIGLSEPNAMKALGLGLIPFFVGIGYLVVWKLGKNKREP